LADADSLSLRKFLGYALDEATPDHSTISRTSRLYWLETHKGVFGWVLKILVGDAERLLDHPGDHQRSPKALTEEGASSRLL
jgi:hypothetical protein